MEIYFEMTANKSQGQTLTVILHVLLGIQKGCETSARKRTHTTYIISNAVYPTFFPDANIFISDFESDMHVRHK